MSKTDIIKTLKSTAETTYKEKGSEFIGRAFPVKNEEDIQNFLNIIRKKYYDASHHCYAFRLKDNNFRYSDAGEPSGTAGIRILNAIDHFEIKDILVIIIRYFGGVKLGVGPLGRAYYYTAEQLLQNCIFQEEKTFYKLTIISDFHFISAIHRIISANSIIIENTQYGEKVTFDCLIPVNMVNKTLSDLSGISNGQIIAHSGKKKIYHTF